MAVTVTKAAPASTLHRRHGGGLGARGSDVYIAAPNAQGEKVRTAKLTLSGTYATNGFALTPADYGLKEIYGLAVLADGTSGGAAVPFLSTTGASPIVKLVTDNVPTELANATSVANHVFTVQLYGV